MIDWLEEGRKLIGTHEGVGKANNPKVVALFADAGHPEIRHDSVAWCAAFVGACLKRAGLEGTGTLWALDYANWGTKLEYPAYGCIATKKRKDKNGKTIGGHVFFVVGWDKASVYALGGNQSDQVSIVKYPRNVVTAWRWPKGYPIPTNYPTLLNPGNFTDSGRED